MNRSTGLQCLIAAGLLVALIQTAGCPVITDGNGGGHGGPADDLWITPPGSVTGYSFQDTPLPADFFGPGSDPFDGRVYLKGVPFDCFDPDGPGPEINYCGLLPTDTIVRRLTDAGPTFPATVQIEIVELSLRSVQPITVSYFGGASFETWDVIAEVHIDAATGNVDPPQTAGTMTIRHEHADGGTFDSTLPVVANLTFVQVGGPGVVGPTPSPPAT